MRFTFLLPGWAWKPVGGYRAVYALATALCEAGHEASVVHARRMPPGTLPPASASMRLRRTADHLRNLVRTPEVTWERLHPDVQMIFAPDLSPAHVPDGDALFATWWGTVDAALACPPSKGLKAYFIQSDETWGGPAERVVATWRRPLLRVVIASWLHRLAVERGVPAVDLVHVPIGLDHSRFSLRRPVEGRLPRIVTQYSSAPGKGFDTALAVMMAVRQQVESLTAVVFGTERPPRGLPDWIEYRRNPPQDLLAHDIYGGAALYLCTSRLEGWHLPPAEALACGCAVVSSDIGGVRDYAVHEETALLASPHDVSGLAGACVRLLRDEPRRVELARAGGKRIRTFTWQRSAAVLADAVEARAARTAEVTA